MAKATPHPAIDPLTGCTRKDIQTEWRAEIVSESGAVRDGTTFYLHPDCSEEHARGRAHEIWMPARNWPTSLRITKVRGPLAAWPVEAPEQVAA